MHVACSLQWGRNKNATEILVAEIDTMRTDHLQWGRNKNATEIGIKGQAGKRVLVPSMGP